MTETEKPLAVVTGSSRGIGREIALALAPHFDILGNHGDPFRNKELNQLAVIAEVEKLGGRMRSVTADIATREGRERLVQDAASTHAGRIAVLCLNAAGGLEKDEGEYYARRINTEAQLDLVDLFSQHIVGNGITIYPTSIYAQGWLPDRYNGYRQFRQPPGYPLVASTKYETERALREKNVKLGVVVGQIVNKTGAHSMFKRYHKERLARMASYCNGGVFPEATEMAEAVRELALGDYPSGHTIYVGGDKAEYADRRMFEPFTLNRAEIALWLPMYSDDKLKADEFISPLGSKLFGATRYQVRPRDVKGHFAGEYSRFKVNRGVDLSEIGAQALGLTFLSVEPQEDAVPFFSEHTSTYEKIVFPREVITTRAEITGYNARGVLGRCDFFVPNKNGGEIQVAQMRGIRLALVPTREMAQAMYERQLSERDIPDRMIF